MNTKFEISQKVSFPVSARHEAKIDCIQIGKNGKITYSVGGVMRDESVLEPVMEKKEQIVTPTNTTFDWDKFRNEKVVVQCKTLKDAKEFLKACHEQGWEWNSGDSLLDETNWEHGEDTCYEYDMGGIWYSPLDFYKNEGYTIVDFPVTHFSWEDFKGEKLIVHCDTEEKANAFLKECDAQGMTWGSGSSLLEKNNWKNYKETTCYETTMGGFGYSNIGGVFVETHKYIPIYEYPTPVAEDKPTQEGKKFYCVEGYAPGEWLTKGKVYTINEYGEITYDDGYTSTIDKDSYFNQKENKILGTYLVPLVKRAGKKGEWVYVLHTSYSGELVPGDISKVLGTFGMDGVFIAKNLEDYPTGLAYCEDEYLVLDGYFETEE